MNHLTTHRYGSERLLKSGFTIIFMSVFFLIMGNFLNLDYIYKFILPVTVYACGFGLISAPLNRAVFTCTKEKKGTVTAMFYLIEMGVASLITLSLSLLAFYQLVIILVVGASLSLFLSQYTKKQVYASEWQN